FRAGQIWARAAFDEEVARQKARDDGYQPPAVARPDRDDFDKLPRAELDRLFAQGPPVVDSYRLRDLNDQSANPGKLVKVKVNPELLGGVTLTLDDGRVVTDGMVITTGEYDELVRNLEKLGLEDKGVDSEGTVHLFRRRGVTYPADRNGE